MPPPLSFVDRDGEVQPLPLRLLVFATLTERDDHVQILEEAPMHAIRSEADLLGLTSRPSRPLSLLVGALPSDGSVLLDLVDTGPLDLMVDCSEVACVTRSAPSRMSQVGYGFGNHGPHAVWVVDPSHSLANPIGRATWSMLGDAARQAQCVVLGNAGRTSPEDDAKRTLARTPPAEVLVAVPTSVGALPLATRLVEAHRGPGGATGLRDITTLSGARLPDVLFAQAITRLLIMSANAARFGRRAFDFEALLLQGAPPLCRLVALSIDGGHYRPDARFTLEGVTHPHWTGEARAFRTQGRFER